MLVHYGCLWGKNKKINMEWRGSHHAVSAESPGKSHVPPCTGHLPLCHQHGTLFCSPQKDRLWIWYIKKWGWVE